MQLFLVKKCTYGVKYLQEVVMRTLDMKVFAERLCTSRHRKQLTKVKLAERAGLKASHLLTYLEKAQQPGVHAATLMQLAQALDVSLDYLVGLTDDPTPHWTRQEGVS
jgi:transcriptional regulator with XRE-family HTH domain